MRKVYRYDLKRIEIGRVEEGPAVTSTNIAVKMARLLLDFNLEQEQFGVLLLDVSGRCIGGRIITVGAVNQTICHPREVFKPAILASAVSIVGFHNHPSGSLTPSEADNKVTNELKKAGEILGINFLDHLIVTEDSHFSYLEAGRL